MTDGIHKDEIFTTFLMQKPRFGVTQNREMNEKTEFAVAHTWTR